MTAFEIAITVLLSFITTAVIIICPAYRLLERLIDRLDNEKKSASENEESEEK